MECAKTSQADSMDQKQKYQVDRLFELFDKTIQLKAMMFIKNSVEIKKGSEAFISIYEHIKTNHMPQFKFPAVSKNF